MGHPGEPRHGVRTSTRRSTLRSEPGGTRRSRASRPISTSTTAPLKRNRAGEGRNVSLLVAISVNADGYRQILGIVEGAKEDKAGWSAFLAHLKGRGLCGVELIVLPLRDFASTLTYWTPFVSVTVRANPVLTNSTALYHHKTNPVTDLALPTSSTPGAPLRFHRTLPCFRFRSCACRLVVSRIFRTFGRWSARG